MTCILLKLQKLKKIFKLSMSRRIRRYIVLIDLSLPSSNAGPIKLAYFFFVACVILRIIFKFRFSQYACLCEQVGFLLRQSQIFCGVKFRLALSCQVFLEVVTNSFINFVYDAPIYSHTTSTRAKPLAAMQFLPSKSALKYLCTASLRRILGLVQAYEVGQI